MSRTSKVFLASVALVVVVAGAWFALLAFDAGLKAHDERLAPPIERLTVLMPMGIVAAAAWPALVAARAVPRRRRVAVGAWVYAGLLSCMAAGAWGLLQWLLEPVASSESPDGTRVAYVFGPGLLGDYELYSGDRVGWVVRRIDTFEPACPSSCKLAVAWDDGATPRAVRADGKPLQRVDWGKAFDWGPH